MKTNVNLLFLAALLAHFSLTWQASASFIRKEEIQEQINEYARTCDENWKRSESDNEVLYEFEEQDSFESDDEQLLILQTKGLRQRTVNSKSIPTFYQPKQKIFNGDLGTMKKEEQERDSTQEQRNSFYNTFKKSVFGGSKKRVRRLNRIGNCLYSNRYERISQTRDDSLPTGKSEIPSLLDKPIQENNSPDFSIKLDNLAPAPSILELNRFRLEVNIKKMAGYGVSNLDLTRDLVGIKFKNGLPYSSMPLVVHVDETSILDYLSIVLNSRSYYLLNIVFRTGFNQNKELVGIIKEKTFKSVALLNHDKINTGICHPIIEELEKENSFLTRIKSLRCDTFSFKSYLKLLELLNTANAQQLKSSSIGLKNLDLSIDESTNETISAMKIDSVEELNLRFYTKMYCKYPIEQLLKMFPNLKTLYIYVFGPLEPFEIRNQKLESLNIQCSEFTDQSEFIEQLRKGKSKLSAITMTSFSKTSYKWIKGDQ